MRGLKIGRTFTPRGSKSLEKYLNDINKIPMIDEKEEVELARRIRNGDEAAFKKLVEANLRFVVSVAKQYIQTNQNLGDLINQGNEGLIIAAKRFDETRGFKFISYAVWWIRQCILEYIGEKSRIVKVPINRSSQGRRIDQLRLKKEQELQRPVSIEELSEELGISIDDILLSKAAYTKKHSSLDELVGEEDEDGDSFLDRLKSDEPSPDHILNTASIQYHIKVSMISNLNADEKYVLVLYFGLNGQTQKTLEEIGTQIGKTRERTRQIKEKALRKLRKSKMSPILKSYLG